MGATRYRIAGIAGAEVRVIAVERSASFARPTVAGVANGADAAIGVAARAVHRWAIEYTGSRERVATIGCAKVIVAAHRRRAGRAGSGRALVADCAGIAIAAREVVIAVLATRNRVTGIIGAGVVVVAVQYRARHAVARRALVGRGANTAVGIAGTGLIDVVVQALACGRYALVDLATAVRRWVARDDGRRIDLARVGQLGLVAEQRAIAEVSVFLASAITGLRARTGIGPGLARAGRADVADGAAIAVIARCGVVGVGATRYFVTGISRAWIAVIAQRRRCHHGADAVAARAGVAAAAGVAVVAGQGVGYVDAAGADVAGVASAQVTVIASDCAARTQLRRALVAAGAGVAVIADVAVGTVDAARNSIATIGSARISVVATLGRCAAAGARRAHVARGAGVAVVAR